DEGNLYIAGRAHSSGFPTTPGSYMPDHPEDYTGIVMKLDPSAQRIIFSTYFGGENGDSCNDLDFDEDGNIYITGSTRSPDLPVTEGAYCTTIRYKTETMGGETYTYPSTEAFVAKLDSTCSKLLWSTYIGGGDGDYGDGIRVERTGSVMVYGSTESTDFPMAGDPFQGEHGDMKDADDDIFILRLSKDGSDLLYSTFLGGNYYDYGHRCFLDEEGSFYVGGGTGSTDFPTTDGAFNEKLDKTNYSIDGFVLKFNTSSGRPEYLTLVGGDSFVYQMYMYLAEDGSVYFAGSTVQTGAVVNPNGTTAMWDVAVGKISPNGSERVFFETFGGNNYDKATDIEVDDRGNIYIQGETTSTDLPTTEDAYCSTYKRNGDCFLAVLNENASEILYLTYYGGSHRELADDMVLDSTGCAILTGDTTFGGDYTDPVSDFPTTQEPFTNSVRVSHIATYLIKINPMLSLPEILNLTEGNVLYADAKAYDFQVDANPWHASDFPSAVMLTLDPTGADVSVVVTWASDGVGNPFIEGDDPLDIIDLESRQDDVVIDRSNNSYILHFRIRFDWAWPHEEWCDVVVDLNNGPGDVIQFVVEDAFRVENDLELSGDLTAVGEWQGPLEDGAWVRVGESLTFTGVHVVYEGTEDIHPPARTCNVMVMDDDGTNTSATLLENGHINVTLTADDETDVDEVYTVSLIDLPFDATSVSAKRIEIGVDGHAPTFDRFIPSADDWHGSMDVLVSMTVSDLETSGIDVSTLEYQTSTSGVADYSTWTRD
ncbi:MAG: SBBP repeat-containing protein, partial [Candidatus Thermoplasmatota archaeon]|nr:SBBP repeat-containing protein [Candidatus Thermoplasmatota archaeon]